MRKILTHVFFLMALPVVALAQDNNNGAPPSKPKRERTSVAYFDLSSGFNAPGSLVGVGGDFRIADNVTIGAGVGLLSTWGYKIYLGGKYFLQPGLVGNALSAGVTYNTGLSDFKMNMESVYHYDADITFNLLPQVNAYAAWYHYWHMGRRNNRFYITAGYSIATSTHKVDKISGPDPSKTSSKALNFLAPGGLMARFGFCFGGR